MKRQSYTTRICNAINLIFYDKRMNKPLRVNVTHTETHNPQTRLKQISWIVYQLLWSHARARQLIKKLKSNKYLIGWNEQGQMSVPSTNIVDLANDSLRQRKNFNHNGWELFSKVLWETKTVLELFAKIKPKESQNIYPPPLECKKREKTQRQY